MKSLKLAIFNFACAFIVLYITILAWSLISVTTQHCDNDFKTFSLALIDHQDPYKITRYVRVLHVEKTKVKTTLETSPPITSVNMNTPLMSLFLKSMLHFSGNMQVDIAIYLMISLVCGGLSIFQLMRLNSVSKIYFIPLLMLLWLSWPALYTLKLGQVSFILLPLLVLSFVLENKKSYRLLAVILGLLASLKLFFLIFGLFFIVKKDWRNLLIFSISFFIFFFIPLFYFKAHIFYDFFVMAANRQLFLDRSTLPMNGSILGVVVNAADMLNIIPTQNQITLSASILCGYVIIRWLIYDFFNLSRLPEFADELRFSFLIILALFCSPLAWIYYFLFLLIPIVTIIKISQRYVLSKWVYVFLIDALLLLYFPFTGKDSGILGFLVRFSVFMSLLCWMFSLIIASQAVKNNVCVQNSKTQPTRMMSLFSIFVLLNLILLSDNYGMPYFLNPNKTRYVESSAPVLWLPITAKSLMKGA